jgi:hypothetical protein
MEVEFKHNYQLDFKTQITQGAQSIQLLENKEFKKGWDYLIKNSVFETVFQDAPFVLSWYRNNLDNFNPVILAGYSDNKLVGLLTLAQKIDKRTGKKSNKLEGAGAFSALYQTWLVIPEFQEIFWTNGIRGIFRVFPKCQINLKSLPNLNGIKLLRNNSEFKKQVVLGKYHNPILDFSLHDINQTLNKRHFRSKFNRLKRAGEVKLERVESKERFNEVLKDIVTFHDLRQGAAFNIVPFGTDAELKKSFSAWFDNGILYASLLILNERIIGAIFLINEHDKIMHLAGLVTYSPWHAKFSPGLVHLYLLGLQFQKEGFQSLNLSPGYDSYKERFSNKHQEVFEILITNNILEIFKRKLRNKIRRILLNRGVRPMDLQVKLSKKKSLIRNRLDNFRHLPVLRNKNYKNFLMEWAESILSSNIQSTSKVSKNNLNELLLVDDYDFSISRWEFLEDALNRLENNQQFISKQINNKLIWCIWYNGIPESENDPAIPLMINKVFVSKGFDIKSNSMRDLKE